MERLDDDRGTSISWIIERVARNLVDQTWTSELRALLDSGLSENTFLDRGGIYDWTRDSKHELGTVMGGRDSIG